ncbi:MAG: hypothetical protein IKQ37_04635 [Bacteroidaceae bacterium]|nr:hypothetical protein [Bacteroidaceae bacterium]
MKRYAFLLLLWAVCLGSMKTLSNSPLKGEDTLLSREGWSRSVIVGTAGDKAVKAYLKKIPQQAEGYYIKVTPTEIVVAGRDESGLFYGLQALEEIQNSKGELQGSRGTPPKGERGGG